MARIELGMCFLDARITVKPRCAEGTRLCWLLARSALHSLDRALLSGTPTLSTVICMTGSRSSGCSHPKHQPALTQSQVKLDELAKSLPS